MLYTNDFLLLCSVMSTANGEYRQIGAMLYACGLCMQIWSKPKNVTLTALKFMMVVCTVVVLITCMFILFYYEFLNSFLFQLLLLNPKVLNMFSATVNNIHYELLSKEWTSLEVVNRVCTHV